MSMSGGPADTASGMTSAMASREGSAAAAKASKQAAYLNWLQYQQSREDLMPWMQAGGRALGTLESKIAAGPGEYQKSPYYNFLASEGMKGIERSAAARGGLLGGATQKGLMRYSEDLASSDFDSWLRRWYQSLTPYQSLAGVGQTAGAQVGAIGANAASEAGNYLSQIGQYRAAGTLGIGSTMANSQSSLGQLAQQLVGNYLRNQGTTQAVGYVSPDIYPDYGADLSGLSGVDWGGGTWL